MQLLVKRDHNRVVVLVGGDRVSPHLQDEGHVQVLLKMQCCTQVKIVRPG